MRRSLLLIFAEGNKESRQFNEGPDKPEEPSRSSSLEMIPLPGAESHAYRASLVLRATNRLSR